MMNMFSGMKGRALVQSQTKKYELALAAWSRTHGGGAVPWRTAIKIYDVFFNIGKVEVDRLIALDGP